MKQLQLAFLSVMLGFALLGGLSLVTPASADPIGGPSNLNCPNDSCQGATYALEFSGLPISMTVDTKTFRVTYTIDTSTYTSGGVKLDTVALKISNSLVSASLFSAPGGTGNWNIQMGGLNSDGCSGSGFECAMANSLGVAPAVGGTLTWVFDLEVGNSATFLNGPGEASVKARYVDANGDKIGALMSENITLQLCDGPDCHPPQNIPEPATMLLMGSGLVAPARKRLL